MKKSGDCLKVYLALFLLIVLVAAFPYKEGFAGDNWLNLSSWFTTKEDDEIKNETKVVIKDNYDDKYGTGSSGRSYVTTTTTNDSSNNIATDEHKWLDTSNWGTYTN